MSKRTNPRIVNTKVAEAHIKKGLKRMGCTDPICRISPHSDGYIARISVSNLRGVNLRGAVDVIHASLDGLVGAVTSVVNLALQKSFDGLGSGGPPLSIF